MTGEQKQKGRFVDRKLAPLLKAMGIGVAGATYEADEYEEFVRVEYGNGFCRRVCVTGDNLHAIAHDVIDRV